jgi:hypothetical protein
MSRPTVCVIAACVLLVGACGEAETAGDATTALAPSTPTSTQSAPSTTRPASTTTALSRATTEPPVATMPAILLAGPDGVFLVEPGKDPVHLVEGRAAVAVDDGLGGLLYQIDAGRDWLQTGEARTTIVWWVPAGSVRPLDLLVPTTDQSLTLEDAVVIGGDLTVLYRRSEGATSFEMVDSLRRYDAATGSVSELLRGSAWEAGFDVGTVGGGLIAGTSYGQIGSSCFFLDLEGAPASTPTNPSIPGCEGPDCPDSCAVSPDGTRLVYLETQFDASTNTLVADVVVVTAMETGSEPARIEMPIPGGGVSDLDVSGDWIIVNRTAGEEQERAWIVNPASTEVPVWEAPVAGIARFVTAPVTVRPSPLVLRGDGLGIVEFGQPVASALPLLEARFGRPSNEWTYDEEDHVGGEACCFCATGYGCERYYRGVVWEEAVLSVIFADGHTYRNDGIPHLTHWSTWEGNGVGPATEAGVSVGDTVGELRAAYGDRLIPTSVGCGDELPAYRLDTEMSMTFELSGNPDDPGTTVTSIWAGSPGSC